MGLHRKRVISLTLVCTLICTSRSLGNGFASNSVGGESGEDENLKEALLLVELLKNEYTRALRENYILRQSMAQEDTVPPENPTCASTTKRSSPNVRVPSFTASRATTRHPTTTAIRATSVQRRLGLMAPFRTVLSRRRAVQNVPNKNFRRRMPSNYLYAALRSLRRANEDEAVSTSEAAAGDAPQLSTKDAAAAASESDVSTAPAAPADDVQTDAPSKATQESKNAVKNKEEPVLSQVADELMSEMKEDRQMPTQARTRRTARNTRYLSAVKPTLRIHLAKSTPLSIPFSKNNAFCYLSPKNALCRSPI